MSWSEYWNHYWSQYWSQYGNWTIIVLCVLGMIACIAALIVLLCFWLVLTADLIREWLDHAPRRLRVAERRIRRLGDLARLDAARIERGEEAFLVEAEARRHQRRDAREDAFKERVKKLVGE